MVCSLMKPNFITLHTTQGTRDKYRIISNVPFGPVCRLLGLLYYFIQSQQYVYEMLQKIECYMVTIAKCLSKNVNFIQYNIPMIKFKT